MRHDAWAFCLQISSTDRPHSTRSKRALQRDSFCTAAQPQVL
jgi:hypothetical protein